MAFHTQIDDCQNCGAREHKAHYQFSGKLRYQQRFNPKVDERSKHTERAK